MRHSRVLVYGAGVIGTFYATLLAAAGEDVSLLARGRRLEQLRSRKDITVLDRLDDGDRFDFIFVAVRSNQMPSALEALRGNVSETLVTLANAYALSETPETIWKDRPVIHRTAMALRGNVKALCREGVRLDPVWLHAIRILPTVVVICVLREVFASKFASVFMRPHAISGREEMAFLHELFYSG